MESWCLICDKEFPSPTRFRLHHSRMHPSEKVQIMTEAEYRHRSKALKKVCSFCDRIFQTDSTCKRHMAICQKKKTSPVEDKVENSMENPILYVRIYDEKDCNKIKYDIIAPPPGIHAQYRSMSNS